MAALNLLLVEPAATEGPPKARFDTAEGWHDLVLPVRDVRDLPNGSLQIDARGQLDGKEVGLRLLVACGIRPGLAGGKLDTTAFFKNGIVFKSLGAPTLALSGALAKVYGENAPPGAARDTIELTVFALAGDPAHIRDQHLNFKVFHDPDNQRGEYFEMFVHIDLPKGEVALHEKDPEYRPAIIQAFAGR